MGTPIPPMEVKFAQLSVQLRYCSPDQVRGCLELYRRYQSSGGEVPSIPRILVQKGFLLRARAELLLRHLIKGDPMPPEAPIGQTGAQAPVQPQASALPSPPPQSAPVDEKEEMIKGLGATVFRGEIKGYKILEVVGEGSMGVVYRAHQISMDRIVALKVLPPGKTKDQSFVESFLTEARNAGRLNHPNLIRVHEVGRWNDLYYYSMEYVEGVTLLDLMDEFEGGRLDAKRAINIFMQVAAALDHGFRMNIIHREIRPNSVMITEGDQAKLDGLGMTRDETTRFLEGENAYYVAPEQAKNGNVDTRSDIYCLGCTLYHALTGEPPFQGGGPKEILGRRLLADVPNPLDVNEEIPKDLAAVCIKMMSRDPGARFQTPTELNDAFKKILAASFQTGAQKPTTKGPKVLLATRPRVHASRRGAGANRRRRR